MTNRPFIFILNDEYLERPEFRVAACVRMYTDGVTSILNKKDPRYNIQEVEEFLELDELITDKVRYEKN